MSWRPNTVLSLCLIGWLGIGPDDARAQDQSKEPPKPGWSNSADLSLVLQAGNASARTIGLSDQLRRVWTNARFDFDVDLVRSTLADDRFFMVDPGLEFPVGGAPANPSTSLVTPDLSLDAANYSARGSYERNITARVL